MKNALNWFEIPVHDIDRAVASYEALLGTKFRRETFGGLPYAVFSYEAPGISGGLVQDPKRAPREGVAPGGTIVSLNVDGELDAVLARAAAAKVTVVLPKTSIGPDGHIAVFVDTEGNTVGLTSDKG
jgi:predicted enzyme related to lactoylglutathione lyase